MNQNKLDILEQTFGGKKVFVNTGYYRIRTVSEDEKEVAYLVSDTCGATTVHPQITIEKKGSCWRATKLIDLETTPTQLIYRKSDTEKLLDAALSSLVAQFEKALKAIAKS